MATADFVVSDLLTRSEAAKYLGNLTPQCLATWAAQKKGPPFIQDGKYVRYKKSDLDDWLQQQRRKFS